MSAKFFIPIIFIGSLLVFFIFFRAIDYSGENIKPVDNSGKITSKISPPGEIKTSIFVPYWSFGDSDDNLNNYDRSIYFGIAVDESGIDKNEQGFLNLSGFNEVAGTNEKLITVRMTNSDVNQKILADTTLQSVIINDSVSIAKENGFSGLVLDLEVFSLFNEKIPFQINEFVSDFSRASKQNNLYFAVAVYGDVFYRLRPYDLKSISGSVGEVMIMAYDFSKSIGEPGPNFPLEGRKKYGYDMKTMIRDFLEVVPAEKLSVIFGMYGYDWTVDSRGRPIKPGQSLTNNQIQTKYLDICQSNCKVVKDKLSQEKNIISGDHIVWFEDPESAQKKQEYLQSQGIGNFIYWAFGYF